MYDKEFCRKRNRKSIQPNFFEEVTADNTLRVPPANHLELLHGDREGQYSIRINIQYRICFNVDGDDFFNVEIVDYHS